MMYLLFILLPIFLWTFIGIGVYQCEIGEGYNYNIKLNGMTQAQKNFVYLMCGPGIWFYRWVILPFWNYLGECE